MESIFKTPSKVSMFEMLPSSGSPSPFTPKRSKIKRKNIENSNSVSRILVFDESNSRSPFNEKLEFSPLSQQAKLPLESFEHDIIKSEQLTPVKVKYQPDEEPTVLLSPSILRQPKRFNMHLEENRIIKSNTRKIIGSNKITPSKKLNLNAAENCKLITSYFKPLQKRRTPPDNTNGYHQSDIHKLNEENTNNVKSLKNINHNVSLIIEQNKTPKKFDTENLVFKNYNLIIQTPEKVTVKNNQINKTVTNLLSNNKVSESINVNEQITPSKTGRIDNTLLRSPKVIELLENKITFAGGDTYSRFVKFITVKGEMVCLGKGDILTKINNCTDDELKIYGRLLSRKHGWIRMDESDGLNKYKNLNLCNNFDSVLTSLATKQLINTDVTSSDLNCLLNILKLQELKDLQKIFNINLNNSKIKTKSEMIKSFSNLVKNQRTFCGNSISNLKKRVKQVLGPCIKVSDSSRDDIMSCLIYETYPYFNGEEKDRFRDCFTKFSLVEKKELKFPNFETKRVSLNFNSKDSLEMYKIALNLRHEIQIFLGQKDYENAITVLKIVFEKFKFDVFDTCLLESLLKIPTYMRKYSAVSVYAHTLFKNISTLKKSTTDKDLTKEVLEFLLKHKEFSMSKIADLHIELAKVFELQYKQLDLAAKVILDGLKDSNMSELDRQMLSTRALMYVNRKNKKLDDGLKNELLKIIKVTKELPIITINGKLIVSREKGLYGRKQIYSKKNENGDLLYMSVEELALSHYNSLGFFNGLHDEGQFLKSMFLLCFWDIIYGSYPDNILFISQYQDCPLDWRTRHFYKIREQTIKNRIEELKQMNVDQICDVLKTSVDKYYNIQSVINWKVMNKNNLCKCKTFLESVGVHLFLEIGNQILKDGRIYLHGMPDLVVWDDINHKCIFVEVKGPNDKLSERQKSWLLKLMEFGANVEVCHVVGTGGKNNNCENMD